VRLGRKSQPDSDPVIVSLYFELGDLGLERQLDQLSYFV
jgi:hypothetical protein